MRILQNPALSLLTLVAGLTGFAALLYQVVWQRLLGLFSGSDTVSVAIVTSAFLAGLGLGNGLASRWSDRLSARRALQVYCACELGIAIFALSSRWLYYDLLYLRWNHLAQNYAVMLLLVFASLLFPTLLMGLSFPLLSRAIVRRLEEAPALITWFYGINTFGAALGTLVSGWYLVGTYGYAGTLYWGAGLSLCAAFLALLAGVPEEAPRSHQPKREGLPREVWFWCAWVFAAGFVMIGLEIVWFRVFDVILKSNAYTFAHLLGFLLLGDALGTLVGGGVVNRIKQPRQWFLGLQILTMFYALLSLMILGELAINQGALNDYLRSNRGFGGAEISWEAFLSVYFVLPALLMFPPMFLIGFYFALVQKAVQNDLGAVGQRVGMVNLFNIAGNALGGLVTGLVLLKLGGTVGALALLLGMVCLIALSLLSWDWQIFSPSKRALVLLSMLAMAVIWLVFPSNQLFWRRLHAVEAEALFWMAEDATGVSAIIQYDNQGHLLANGQVQGYLPFGENHLYLGSIPPLVHPNPQNILVIGFGSGATPYGLGTGGDETQRIKVLEIVGSELNALSSFRDDGHLPVLHGLMQNDPRYEIKIGDGRRELLLSQTKYDLIQADAILPQSSHSGLLYSRDFFMAARAQLATGGIMAQWRASPRTEATFLSVFPHVIILDTLMLGSNEPIPYDYADVVQQLEANHAYLEAGAYVGVVEQLLARLPSSPTAIYGPQTPRSQDIDLNTDLRPRDEYYLNN